MKARNNKTGEIVTNFFMSKEFGTISYLDSSKTLRIAHACDYEWTMLEDENDDFPILFDWQSFRNQAAKDILCAMIQGGYGQDRIEHQSTLAVKYATELVKQLK